LQYMKWQHPIPRHAITQSATICSFNKESLHVSLKINPLVQLNPQQLFNFFLQYI
jgi:hypothetical protein